MYHKFAGQMQFKRRSKAAAALQMPIRFTWVLSRIFTALACRLHPHEVKGSRRFQLSAVGLCLLALVLSRTSGNH